MRTKVREQVEPKKGVMPGEGGVLIDAPDIERQMGGWTRPWAEKPSNRVPNRKEGNFASEREPNDIEEGQRKKSLGHHAEGEFEPFGARWGQEEAKRLGKKEKMPRHRMGSPRGKKETCKILPIIIEYPAAEKRCPRDLKSRG